jgi:predicted transcriptional regulator
MEGLMNTVTLSVASRDDVSRRVEAAFQGREQGSHISFASVDLLWQTLTKKRREILQAMTGQGEMSVRTVARRVGRDTKAVQNDLMGLIAAGVIEQTADGVAFAYDAVHVDFMLTKAPPRHAA